MAGNLVIVESPTKAKKIQGFLGDGYVVKSSQGHIRDLEEKKLGIDIPSGFMPHYVIPSGKARIVSDLKKEAAKADTVWLASDEDREGEAIAWHLKEVLGLRSENTHRIAFHEITKNAILEAIKNPRDIDMDLVGAQQARRVLDRLVGFELSPVLWKKIQPKLSAGRVQSVALRLVVDREREIMAFGSEMYYRVEGTFLPQGCKTGIKGVLDRRFATSDEAYAFLGKCADASFSAGAVTKKEGIRTPAAPFTTSSLQQEAGHKLHMSVTRTMQVAQKLYEEGLITYMRTDSVNLSSLAINTAKQVICDNFGEEYSRPRRYKTSTKGAQEAHEAIRPTYIANARISGTPEEKKLYSLIWKRTVASQMADAKVLNTSIEIVSPSFSEKFIAEGQEILFDGFLKLYMESDDEDQEDSREPGLPEICRGMEMKRTKISAEAKFTQPPHRYSQPTLVKKLEELQIGRPSTYASTISTLIKGRGYIVEGDKEGRMEEVTNLTLEGNGIKQTIVKEKVGYEKGKLMPRDIGMMVSDFLVEHFPDVMDYGFTADVEKQFDDIAEGRLGWNKVIEDFYSPFHDNVRKTVDESGYSHLEREIGIDPSDGRMIVARYGQFGPYVQKGEGNDKVHASLGKGQIIESLTLEDALKLFQLPRNAGRIDGKDVIIAKGRYGAYIKYDGRNISLPRGTDPLKVSLEECAGLISAENDKPAFKTIAQWGDIHVLEGRYGPYIKDGKSNYKLPAGCDAYTLTEDDVRAIIANSDPTSRKRRFFKKK